MLASCEPRSDRSSSCSSFWSLRDISSTCQPMDTGVVQSIPLCKEMLQHKCMIQSITDWIAALYVDNCAWHIGDDKWMCTMICICVRSHLQTPLGHPPSYRSCFGHVPLPWSKQSCKTLDRLFPKRLHYQPRVHHHFKLIGDYSLKTQWTRPPTVVWCKEWKEWMPHSTASAAEAGWNGCKNSPATGHIQ